MLLKTHVSTNEYLAHFLLITVSFLTYLIIFTPHKMLLIFSVIIDISSSCAQLKLKTQTRFMVLFTSRSLTTWGKSQDALPGISPRYLLTIHLNNQFPTSLQKSYDDWICLLFKQGRKVEKGFGFPMGEFWCVPPPQLLQSSLAITLQSWFLSAASKSGEILGNLAMTLPIYWST